MKSFILFISLFMFNLHAGEGVGDSSGGGKLTWSKILSNYGRYVPDAHKIRFNNRSFEPFEVCYLPVTDELRTAKEVKVYNRTSRGDRDIWSSNGKKFLF